MDKLKEILEQIKYVHVFAVIIAYAGYSYYFQDMTEIQSKQAHGEELLREIETVKNKIEQAKAFEKQIEEKRAQLADLDAQLRSKKAELPKTFNVPELLNDIFAEAQQVGLEVQSVAPDSKETKMDLYASMRIEVASKGTFLQIFIFLDRLSKLKRLVGVTNVVLGSGSATDRTTLKGTTGALSGKRLSGGEKTFRTVTGKITLLAYRII